MPHNSNRVDDEVSPIKEHRPPRSARIVPAKNWHERAKDRMKLGDRAADILRNGMGSWRFVGGFIGFMLIWAWINSLGSAWDPYPFILLNLLLSMLAGLQGAILLISARRQDAVAAALAQNDYETNAAAKEDIEKVLAMNDQQTTLLLKLLDLHVMNTGDTAQDPEVSRSDPAESPSSAKD